MTDKHACKFQLPLKGTACIPKPRPLRDVIADIQKLAAALKAESDSSA